MISLELRARIRVGTMGHATGALHKRAIVGWLVFIAAIGLAADAAARAGGWEWPPTKFIEAKEFLNAGLRGVNLGHASPRPRPPEDFEELQKIGAKLVRIILFASQCKGCSGYAISANDLAYARMVLAMGERYGFYVVLTLSPQPAGRNANYWDDDLLQASIVETWKEIAKEFVGNKIVAGYDLINEPISRSILGDDRETWRKLAERIVRAIRTVDGNHAIIFEPSPGALPTAFRDLTPLPYENVIYSVHFYEPHKLTHQGLGSWNAALAYPNDKWNRQALEVSLQPVADFARKYRVPIYVGEFSCARWAPNDSAFLWVRDSLSIFEKNGWSWSYHAFREAPAWDAEVPEGAQRMLNGEAARALRNAQTQTFKLLKSYLEAK